jgi:glyoxylate/hydroxypyruvate reductase
MQRLSQLSSQLARESIYNSANNSTATPHRPKHNHPANTNTTMAKPKVVVTRQLIDEAQALLDAKKDDLEIVQWNSEKVHLIPPLLPQILTCNPQPCPRPWLLENAAGATGILVMLSDAVNTQLLDAAGPSLKAIASFSVGTDHVDCAALKARNIRLGYTPTCLTDAVADLTVMLVLMAQRRAGEAMSKVEKGEWPQMPWHPLLMTGPQIRGSTVGFLGFGRIAQASLVRLLPFGIKKVAYLTSTPGKPAREDHFGILQEGRMPIEPAQSMEELARESDVVIVSCALTPSTHHIVSTPFFNLMKRTAVIVNIARGPVIDTDALVTALNDEKIFGAGLDVIENEPNIAADHPILKQKRCVLLPHVGSATTETREMMALESVKNLLAGVGDGEMVNEVEL